jgi:hypothetical protein
MLSISIMEHFLKGQASRSWMTLNISGRVSVFHLVFDVPSGRENVCFDLSILRDLQPRACLRRLSCTYDSVIP